ncbi:MAG: divalent-cation tolerance protein CutA [Proteobacteria bacterium]|nr:divalent-cation tolerance protein CutA [Pseudomonadota bacterium]
MSGSARLILTTCGTKEQAQLIAHALINKRLIACATLMPQAQSIYRWEGNIVDEAETVLLMKSTAGQIPELEKELLTLHPYRVPEFVVLEPTYVGAAYAQWLQGEVG